MIRNRLDLEATIEPGRSGQFDVLADGELVAERRANFLTRRLGAGYPDFEDVIDTLDEKLG